MWRITMFFNFFRSNKISGKSIKKECEKIAKKINRETNKKLKKGMLPDSHSLAEHLNYIDKCYAHLKQEINNTTHKLGYEKERGEKYSTTRTKLDEYQTEYDKLKELRTDIVQLGKKIEHPDRFTSETIPQKDNAKLRKKFEELDRKDRK